MSMDRRTIGSLEVTALGLGTNNFGYLMDADEVEPVVMAALEVGINFFDTADCYEESEARLGRALGRRRADVVVATKFGQRHRDFAGGASPGYIRQAVDRSLRELGTDYIDLYQLHLPDPATPIAETLAALDDLVKAGKVREIGCSNFNAAQLREAGDATADGAARFVSVQNRYNLLNRADEAAVLPECERAGLGYLPCFPLSSGLLSGKYRRDEAAPADTRFGTRRWPADVADRWVAQLDALRSERNFDVIDQLSAWAQARGRSLLEVALGWLASRSPITSFLVGASTPAQVAANAAAASWRLDPSEIAEVDALTAPDPAAG
jgi:aryl-alcohol dehydrogenase-like predicted oxidoreductase